MNKKKPKYRIGWQTILIVMLGVAVCLLLACDHALSGEYGRMCDNICFAVMALCYLSECYFEKKALNVANDTIRINEELADINTKLEDHTKAALAAYESADRKVKGMKNAVRVSADALRMARAKVKLLDKECGRLHQKLEAYEDEEVRV